VAGPITTAKSPKKSVLGEPEACVVTPNGYDAKRDYCIPEGDSASSGGVYVSLVANPERFTGYAGDHAHAIWREIYSENCFELQPQDEEEEAMVTKHQMSQTSAMTDLEAVMLGRPKGWTSDNFNGEIDPLRLQNTCLEKRVFWRLISGMHTSISTHLCWDYLNQTSGEWVLIPRNAKSNQQGPNVECFKSRVWNNPQWIENLYFNYVVVLRAITKLSTYLEEYTYCTGDSISQNDLTVAKVRTLISTAQVAAPSFDESRMFDPADPTIYGLKDEFRERFRNVSRIMDCVGCDKCRLWGKLQTSGYGTALKVLFEFDSEDIEGFHLRRTEVVSLIVTLQRLSHSIWAVQQFKDMILNPLSVPVTTTKPEKIIAYVKNADYKSVGQTWREELAAATAASDSVLKSYAMLPVNVWKWGVVVTSTIWDRYITGRSSARLDFDPVLS